jgi:hypothetical protein
MTCHHAPITGHQPIPEDEAHCPCHLGMRGDPHKPHVHIWSRCDCPCHAPAWLDDASVPDLIEDPLD